MLAKDSFHPFKKRAFRQIFKQRLRDGLRIFKVFLILFLGIGSVAGFGVSRNS